MVVNKFYKERVLTDARMRSALVQKPGEQPKSMFGIVEGDFFIGFDCETSQFVRYFIANTAEQVSDYLERNIPVLKRFLNYGFKHCDDREFQHMYQMYRKGYDRYLEDNPLLEDSNFMAVAVKRLSEAGLKRAIVQKPGEQPKSMFGIEKEDFFIGFDCESKQFVRYFIVDSEEQAEEYLENNIPVFTKILNLGFTQYDKQTIKTMYEMYKNDYSDYVQNNLVENNHTLDKILKFSNNIGYATYLNYAGLNDEDCLKDNGFTKAFSLLRYYSDGSYEACPLEFLRPTETCTQYRWYPRLEKMYDPGSMVFVYSTIPLDLTRMSDPNINYICELCDNYEQHLASENAIRQKVQKRTTLPQ